MSGSERSEELTQVTQVDRLLAIFKIPPANIYQSNFVLYGLLYGDSPCGRLGAVVHVLRRRGWVITGLHDGEYREYCDQYGWPAPADKNGRRYWYCFTGEKLDHPYEPPKGKEPEPDDESTTDAVMLLMYRQLFDAAEKLVKQWGAKGIMLWDEEKLLKACVSNIRVAIGQGTGT